MHWREIHVQEELVPHLKRILPTFRVQAEQNSFIAVAELVAQTERKAAMREIEAQVGKKIGSGILFYFIFFLPSLAPNLYYRQHG